MIPRAWRILKVLSKPPPDEPPPGYPLWPLWYVASAFLVTRLAGGFFVLGLILTSIWPVFLS